VDGRCYRDQQRRRQLENSEESRVDQLTKGSRRPGSYANWNSLHRDTFGFRVGSEIAATGPSAGPTTGLNSARRGDSLKRRMT
jgi:hypothetical protein